MKKLLTVLLSVLMVLTLGIVNVAAEGEEPEVIALPEEIDIDNTGYCIVKASAPSKEYTGKRYPADIKFNLYVSGTEVSGLKKLDLIDLAEDLWKSKNLFDIIEALAKERWESWDADYIVIYTQKVNGHDVIVEPKNAGKYTATVIFRPLTEAFKCSFLRKDELGRYGLVRYSSVEYEIEPAKYENGDSAYKKFDAPTARNLVVNGSQQTLADAGEVIANVANKDVKLTMEYSKNGINGWTTDISTLKEQAAGDYKIYYRVNHKDSARYNPNFKTYDGNDMFINVTIKPSYTDKPKRPYTPVLTGY